MHGFLYPQVPDLNNSPDTLHIHPNPTIGIAEVRELQTFLSRKPTQSQFSLVVIHDAHLMTLPAQHAILKILEEPPNFAQIYLITPLPDQLLPTVLSRVQTVNAFKNPSPPDTQKAKTLLNQLLASSVPQRLSLIESQNYTRDLALEFLDALEHLLHDQIQKNPKVPELDYELISSTRKFIKANCNLKLTMDYFAISLKSPNG